MLYSSAPSGSSLGKSARSAPRRKQPTGPTTLKWRSVRSAVMAVLTALIAVAGHVLGGGAMPDMAAIIAVTAILGAAFTGPATTRQRFAPILGAIVWAQVLFHLIFQLSSHHQMPLNLSAMVVFHLLAAVVSAGLLSHGDRLLFELFAALRRILPRLLMRPSVVDKPPSWTAIVGLGTLHLQLSEIATSRPRRGPPATV